MAKTLKLVLTGRIPSKKNSRRSFFNKKTGHIMTYYSPEYKTWQKEKLEELATLKAELVPGKVSWSVFFYLPDLRTTDLSNKNESLQDLLVDAGIIEDDNCKILSQTHNYFMGVDRERPRAEIEITSLE